MTTQQEVRAIVGKLPPAQKRAIKACGAFSLVVARRLAKAGLVSSYARHTGENFVRIEFTPLGLLVQAALKDHPNVD
jgi:hypothetical protein